MSLNTESAALELDKYGGDLPARTTQKIRASIFPARRVNYNISLSYELLSQYGECIIFMLPAVRSR